MNPTNPIIVQSDRTILLEVDHPLHAEARDALAQFAELEKSPEHIHTYRLSPLSLWNAAAGGMSASAILELLTHYSKYPLPSIITVDIRDYISRYGRIKLIRKGDALLLTSEDMALIAEVMHHKRTQPYILRQIDRNTIQVDASRRGHVKQALIHMGFPARTLRVIPTVPRYHSSCFHQLTMARSFSRAPISTPLRRPSTLVGHRAEVAAWSCCPVVLAKQLLASQRCQTFNAPRSS